MGQEYMRSHRTFVQLAVRLANVGFPVLRFDYFGTGDSSGDSEQGNSLQWIVDISSAVDELKRQSGLKKICLVGLRLGASLATITGERRKDIDSLVLWDPIVDGESYIRELKKLQAQMMKYSYARMKKLTRDGTHTEILGFPISDLMFSDLMGINLLQIHNKTFHNVLIVQNSNNNDIGKWKDSIMNPKLQMTYKEIPGPRIWLEEPHKGLVPHDLLEYIVSWMSGVYP
jgi:pimeloyl-ACP methyl ester carboxylesterase